MSAGSASGWADDFTSSNAAIGDDVLAVTHGTGKAGTDLFEEEDSSGGATQSVDIGTLNGQGGFGNSNAVAVAIVHQNVVQVIGSGGIGDILGN